MRKYFNDAHLAKKAGRTRSERLAIFFDLVALRIMRRFSRADREECRVQLLGYEVWGFSYAALDFLFREVFLAGEYYIETPNTRPVIVDCGANVGMSVLYFKHLFPNARILAFEPNPNAFRMLQKNVAANGIRDVELHNIALSDREGEISFFISSDPGTLLGSTRRDRGGNIELKAKAGRLSQYLRDERQVDLVKIDVEGSELSIIDELIEASSLGKVDQYIVEYHHRINNDPSNLGDFLKRFETAGYDYNLKAAYRRAGSFQDVLLHFYRDGRPRK
ncbi:MAG TPA: FkbM family methyltransferase [Burkholderiales bacterium]|nr:FkbM family methyltransferase [Burkholderiales bacterium]